MKKNCAVIILTKDEEKHLRRTLSSIQSFASEIYIIDSQSTDKTVEIAEEFGANVFQNKWINYATQFQWALDNCPIKSDWIMRMDADEYVTPELAEEIAIRLDTLNMDVTGVVLKRQVHFMGKWIRRGGYYPIKLLRIWRKGFGEIERKWMDEHIILSSGSTVEFDHDIVDANLNTLSWWTEKHNVYATREAIDLLNRKHNIFEETAIETGAAAKEQAGRKRWLKENLYAKAPLFMRAFLYFNFRYWIQLGFLDGRRGLVWHFLQGFWYRFLVDAKIFQIESRAKERGCSIREIIEDDFNFKTHF